MHDMIFHCFNLDLIINLSNHLANILGQTICFKVSKQTNTIKFGFKYILVCNGFSLYIYMRVCVCVYECIYIYIYIYIYDLEFN